MWFNAKRAGQGADRWSTITARMSSIMRPK
jgi:hypothetical protein